METIKSKIDSSNISFLQFLIIFICFFLNIIDGMDVLVISYTAPVIASSWDISFEALVSSLKSALDLFQPNEVFIPSLSDAHSDHRIVFDAASSCASANRSL